MTAPMVLVTGVGTDVGKTHLAEAILIRWGRSTPVAGYKPVETGVGATSESDEGRLRRASTFHVKHFPGLRFGAPVSPHLAAAMEGTEIAVDTLIRDIVHLRTLVSGLVVELAGGLFTPLTRRHSNVDVVRALSPARTFLVASDRLGVLHDVLACCHAAPDLDLEIVLMAPLHRDASSGTNAAELRQLQQRRVLGPVPRGTPSELAESDAVASCVDLIRLEGSRDHPAESRPRNIT